MNPDSTPTAPEARQEDEQVRLSYEGSKVPWWVILMWLSLFVFIGVYMVRLALPSIQRMMAENQFHTFPF